MAVRAGACKNTSRLMWCPSDQVYGSLVLGEVVEALEGVLVFAPDYDAAVVAGGCEEGTVFGVGEGYAPDRSVVAARSRCC